MDYRVSVQPGPLDNKKSSLLSEPEKKIIENNAKLVTKPKPIENKKSSLLSEPEWIAIENNAILMTKTLGRSHQEDRYSTKLIDECIYCYW